ncbi:hypothetical protein MUO79_02125, partial [Candidatus Bathyarchaeota archaeon]|nr:hypothetical protein [Candidatus Bathyarchaeota archaeon]
NNRGRAFSYAGRGDMSLDLADYNAALQIFEEENSLADAADALWRSGLLTTGAEGSLANGLCKLLRSVAIFRELGDARKEAEATLWTGMAFSFFWLFPEARREFANVLRVGEKLGMFNELAEASQGVSILDEHDGNLAEALSQTLKAMEYAKKTDAVHLLSDSDSLTRLYCKLGDLKHAEDSFKIMMKMPPELLKRGEVFGFIAVTKAVYSAVRGQWEESNQAFEKYAEFLKTFNTPNFEVMFRRDYAWALERQGRVEEARVQRDRVQKLLQQADERFGHANVQLSVMAPRKVQVGEEFEMRLDLVNVGRSPSVLAKVAGATPPEFNVVGLPSFCSLQNSSVEMKEKSVSPFQVETVKLQVNVTKAGSYTLNPEVVYVDDLGNTKTFKANSITVTAQAAKPAYEILPGRITTGYAELDKLLLGGIPEKYAVVLATPSCDEREMLVNRFLRAGVEAGEETFYVTADPNNGKALAKQYPLNFYLFVCNPQAETVIQNQLNIYKLKGIENLTEIDIALTKAFRTLNSADAKPRRACIEIVSDILLQHHAVTTRKWLSGLLPTLKSKGFTTLAIMNPQMHSQEEVQAILGLFEGEIRVTEKETAQGTHKILRIGKLHNQKYSETELSLHK